MQIRDLVDTPIPLIHEAFLDAFSDYVVPFTPSEEQLAEMLRRRGYEPALSVGVFDGDLLVGFTLNGSGWHNGLPTAYDTGTGVRPSHRGRHLAKGMFDSALDRLASRGVAQYLLEVITTNDRAVGLYQKLGFEVVREFQCWKHDGARQTQPTNLCEVQQVKELPWNEVSRFMDVRPAWQNSADSIRRSGETRVLLVAEDGGQLGGFAVVYPASGDVPQLAVHHESRRKGIGTALLAAAQSVSNSGALRLMNIDESGDEISLFLEHIGAERFVRQYEMLMPVRQVNTI